MHGKREVIVELSEDGCVMREGSGGGMLFKEIGEVMLREKGIAEHCIRYKGR